MADHPLPPGDDARPDADEFALYTRAYLQRNAPATLFTMWRRALAHALLLEAEPERVYPEHGGLSALQLGEGARVAARRMALLLAEAPTAIEAVLELKIASYETMAFDDHEFARSHTAVMMETAMHRDAAKMGIALGKVPFDSVDRH